MGSLKPHGRMGLGRLCEVRLLQAQKRVEAGRYKEGFRGLHKIGRPLQAGGGKGNQLWNCRSPGVGDTPMSSAEPGTWPGAGLGAHARKGHVPTCRGV